MREIILESQPGLRMSYFQHFPSLNLDAFYLSTRKTRVSAQAIHKPTLSIVNNKLLKQVFATAKPRIPYDDKYKSVLPSCLNLNFFSLLVRTF